MSSDSRSAPSPHRASLHPQPPYDDDDDHRASLLPTAAAASCRSLRRLCGPRMRRRGPLPWLARCMPARDRYQLLIYSRATISTYGNIIFWVGAWDLLSEYKASNEKNKFALFHASNQTDIAYITVGFLFMLLAGSLFLTAGIQLDGIPAFSLALPNRFFNTQIGHSVRVFLSSVGAFCVWVGCYNTLDARSAKQSSAKHALLLLAGYIGMLCLDISVMANVRPEAEAAEAESSTAVINPSINTTETAVDEEPAIASPAAHLIAPQLLPSPQRAGSWSVHGVPLMTVKDTAVAYLRALLSVVFQTMIWFGGFTLMELHYTPTVWRELAYMSCGVLALVATDAFIANSCIDFDGWPWVTTVRAPTTVTVVVGGAQPQPQQPQQQQQQQVSQQDHGSGSGLGTAATSHRGEGEIAFLVRATIALAGQVANNVGFWTLIDIFLYPTSAWRNVIYVILGATLLWSVDTFHFTIGLEKPSFKWLCYRPRPEDPYEMNGVLIDPGWEDDLGEPGTPERIPMQELHSKPAVPAMPPLAATPPVSATPPASAPAASSTASSPGRTASASAPVPSHPSHMRSSSWDVPWGSEQQSRTSRSHKSSTLISPPLPASTNRRAEVPHDFVEDAEAETVFGSQLSSDNGGSNGDARPDAFSGLLESRPPHSWTMKEQARKGRRGSGGSRTQRLLSDGAGSSEGDL